MKHWTTYTRTFSLQCFTKFYYPLYIKVSDFNHTIQSEIIDLAKSILSHDEIHSAEHVSEMLLKDEGSRNYAIGYLRGIIGTSPKRPVYYLEHEIGGLPEYSTRHVVRYAGDYIDQLIKYCSYDKGDFLLWKTRGLHKSLGQNLHRLKNVLSKDLIDVLTRFNEIIYVPAKHTWDIPEGRKHLFSSKEAVYVCLMVKRLSVMIEPYSEFCVSYNKNEQVHYYYDSSQKGRRNE